ncbi:hypothetical protein BG58_37190 [Caballeronia jiangsuensis]|nr:hypothetical protein BG58_37190 [Caballeronia jiangsuensis]
MPASRIAISQNRVSPTQRGDERIHAEPDVIDELARPELGRKRLQGIQQGRLARARLAEHDGVTRRALVERILIDWRRMPVEEQWPAGDRLKQRDGRSPRVAVGLTNHEVMKRREREEVHAIDRHRAGRKRVISGQARPPCGVRRKTNRSCDNRT